MACTSPLVAYSRFKPDGKRQLFWKVADLKLPAHMYDRLELPCGRCMACRLERSRQWAARILCEAREHEASSFVTLTYDDGHLPVGSTLVKRDLQLWFKRLRKSLSVAVRYYAAGEYGDQSFRPHYHVCLFGYDFPDRQLFKRSPSGDLFTSVELSESWGLGHCLIGALTFDSAAYVARYCTKLVSGKDKEAHYHGRLPEFSVMSRRPGIGATWLSKYAEDVYPYDELVVRGVPCKPPRFFDEKYGCMYPGEMGTIKSVRASRVKPESDSRRAVRAEVLERRLQAVRSIKESSYG